MSVKSTKPPTTKELNIKIDLESYFANTIIPQLFVDSIMVLRIFTPPAMKQFSLSSAVVGKKIQDVEDNIKYPTIVENIEEVIYTGKILEKEIQTTDGKWFQMNILPYQEKSTKENNGVIITFVDITNRITTVTELERLNAEYDILMHTLSHDIKQPLSTMSLLTDILHKTFEKKDEKQFAKFMDTLKNTIVNMKTIIDNFTDDRKKNSLTDAEERLNIENIVENVISSLHSDIVKNKIEITQNYKTSEIKGNPALILENLEISPNRRAENLTLEEWIKLANFLNKIND